MRVIKFQKVKGGIGFEFNVILLFLQEEFSLVIFVEIVFIFFEMFLVTVGRKDLIEQMIRLKVFVFIFRLKEDNVFFVIKVD